MANTTSQVTSYRAAGQPDDSVGAVGDICWDTANRVTWVKQAGNTWAGGAYSNIGPTGPAMLAGSGSPGSSFGQIGNGYTDTASGLTYLKSSSGWAQTGNITGPQGTTGAAGYTNLTTQAASAGAIAYSVNATLSSTPQNMLSAAGMPSYAAVPQSGALMGVNAVNNGVASTITLYDSTASKTIYSASVSANSNFNSGTFAATTYPLDPSHVYVWQIAGSGTSNIVLSPFYLLPAMQTTAGVGVIGGYTSPTGTALSSTVQYLCPGPAVASGSANSRQFVPIRSSLLFSVLATFVPNSASDASATATFTLYGYNQSAKSTSTIATWTATNTGSPKLTQFSTAISLSAATSYYIGITGSGTGLFDSQLLVST